MSRQKPYRDLRGNEVSNASIHYSGNSVGPMPSNTPAPRGGWWDPKTGKAGEAPPPITPQQHREAALAGTILNLKEEFFWLAGNEKAENAVGAAAAEAMRNDANLSPEQALRTAAEMLTSLGGEFARPVNREEFYADQHVAFLESQRPKKGI